MFVVDGYGELQWWWMVMDSSSDLCVCVCVCVYVFRVWMCDFGGC